MRSLYATIGVALLVLVASPALAGDPRGGGHHGGGHPGGGCGSRCGGGGGHPPPSPPPVHGGGFNGNINVNVNANASAQAWAGASGGGYINARAYDMGGFRGGGYGGGTVYVGGGYGGDAGGYYGGGAIYNEEVYEGRTCASAPFGYVVAGFGRTGRRAPACVENSGGCRVDVDRGGRYGYSRGHACGGGRRETCDAPEDRGACDGHDARPYRADDHEHRSHGDADHPGVQDCSCDRATPYPPAYRPEPPRVHAPGPRSRPGPSAPPRQHYSQEPGERG